MRWPPEARFHFSVAPPRDVWRGANRGHGDRTADGSDRLGLPPRYGATRGGRDTAADADGAVWRRAGGVTPSSLALTASLTAVDIGAGRRSVTQTYGCSGSSSGEGYRRLGCCYAAIPRYLAHGGSRRRSACLRRLAERQPFATRCGYGRTRRRQPRTSVLWFALPRALCRANLTKPGSLELIDELNRRGGEGPAGGYGANEAQRRAAGGTLATAGGTGGGSEDWIDFDMRGMTCQRKRNQSGNMKESWQII